MEENKLHVIKESSYINIFLLLIVLTILTLSQPAILHLELAPTLYIQMSIAFVKAFLIIAYYMHIKESPKLFQKIIYTSFLLLAVLYTLMAIDTYARYVSTDFFN